MNDDGSIPVAADECLRSFLEHLRGQCHDVEVEVRVLMEHSVFERPEAFPRQHAEMKANLMLAVRHLEDARMRLGKVLQYARDGVSSYDR